MYQVCETVKQVCFPFTFLSPASRLAHRAPSLLSFLFLCPVPKLAHRVPSLMRVVHRLYFPLPFSFSRLMRIALRVLVYFPLTFPVYRP